MFLEDSRRRRIILFNFWQQYQKIDCQHRDLKENDVIVEKLNKNF